MAFGDKVNEGKMYVCFASSSAIFHPVIVTGDVPEFVIFTHSSSRWRPLMYTVEGVSVVGAGVTVTDVGEGASVAVGSGVSAGAVVRVAVGASSVTACVGSGDGMGVGVGTGFSSSTHPANIAAAAIIAMTIKSLPYESYHFMRLWSVSP